MTDWGDRPAVVLDNGSGICRAGFAGDDAPKTVFPMVVGSPRESLHDLRLEPSHTYVADEAMSKRGIMALRHPVERGVVNNWDDMLTVWWHTYRTALKVEPHEQAVLITEATLNPASNREKLAENMFEKLGVPALYVSSQGPLCLFASGKTSGLIVNSGEGATSVTPIYEGHMISSAVSRMNVAGRDVTAYLCKLLEKQGKVFRTSGEIELVRDMKEKHCAVALDYDVIDNKDSYGNIVDTYELPDGQIINLGIERYKAAELLFQPSLQDHEYPGLTNLIWGSIRGCELDVRKSMYSNMLLAGGSTMLTGLKERLEKDIRAKAPNNVDVCTVASDDRKHSAWIGGALLASLVTFQNMWITKRDYEECGVSLVHTKCT